MGQVLARFPEGQAVPTGGPRSELREAASPLGPHWRQCASPDVSSPFCCQLCLHRPSSPLLLLPTPHRGHAHPDLRFPGKLGALSAVPQRTYVGRQIRYRSKLRIIWQVFQRQADPDPICRRSTSLGSPSRLVVLPGGWRLGASSGVITGQALPPVTKRPLRPCRCSSGGACF